MDSDLKKAAAFASGGLAQYIYGIYTNIKNCCVVKRGFEPRITVCRRCVFPVTPHDYAFRAVPLPWLGYASGMYGFPFY